MDKELILIDTFKRVDLLKRQTNLEIDLDKGKSYVIRCLDSNGDEFVLFKTKDIKEMENYVWSLNLLFTQSEKAKGEK